MKRIEILDYGNPEDVARCVEYADPPPPGMGEILIEVLAFPINPADIAFCKGNYASRPPLPAVPGAECVARVQLVGEGVSGLHRGDLVISALRENWMTHRVLREFDVIRIPPDSDLRQAAMLRINPPTAELMLTDIIDLSPGDWVIQNAANSAVGRMVIAFARQKGLKTVNVVRRQDAIDGLYSLSGDVCLVDGPDLASRVREATAGAPMRLALDAISGDATLRLGQCLSDGGTVANYGAMSETPAHFGTAELVFRGITLRGFLRASSLARFDQCGLELLYSDLSNRLKRLACEAPVIATLPMDDIRDALRLAQEPARAGKVIVTTGAESL